MRRNYFPQLDTLRWFAILLVLLSHWTKHEWISYKFQSGKLGVELFFVISGFLITGILLGYKEEAAGPEFSIRKGYRYFYLRRVFRIFPLYYAVLGVLYLFNTGGIREQFIWHLTYTSNIFMTYVEGNWIGNLSILWSLAVEEQFYLIWPLIIFSIPRKYLPHTFGGLILIALVYRGYWTFGPREFLPGYIMTPSCLDLFAFGGLLAWLRRYRPDFLQKILKNPWKWALLPLFVLGPLSIQFAELGFNNTYFLLFWRTVVGACWFFIVGKSLSGYSGWLGRIMDNKAFIWLGRLSYSMYLWHNFIPGFYMGQTFPENEILRYLMYFLTLVPLSWISWKFIEMPFQKLKNKFSH